MPQVRQRASDESRETLCRLWKINLHVFDCAGSGGSDEHCRDSRMPLESMEAGSGRRATSAMETGMSLKLQDFKQGLAAAELWSSQNAHQLSG